MRLLLAALAAMALLGGEDLASRVQTEALAYAEARVSAQAGAYAFRVLKAPTLPPVKPGEVTLEASHLSKEDPSGHCFVAVKVLVNGRPVGLARVDLEGRWKGELLRAKSSLPRKLEVDAEVFERVPFEGQLPSGALTELPEGHRLRQAMQAGKWLTRSDVEPIPIVLAGERVRLTASSGTLSMETEATARTSGAKGDTVRLELPTRKIVTAKVTGSGLAWLDFTK